MEIRPFKAYRFDADVVGRSEDCIAPPYDVINSEQQQELYRKNKYNIVRIIKGKTEPADSPQSNTYTRAADYLNSWINEGALKQDAKPSIYAYVQDFELAGAWFKRLSFVAQMKLEEFGSVVRPHEQTLLGPKQDRLELLRTTKARFGLVFMLYEDRRQAAEKIIEEIMHSKALIDTTDEYHVRHRLYAVNRQEDINAIVEMMKNKSCIIADGHHRYETGLIYAKQSDNPQACYQVTAFTNTVHEGLVVLATHRVINNLEKFDLEVFLKQLEEYFVIEKYPFDSEESAKKAKHKMLAKMRAAYSCDENAFGLYGGKNAFYTVILREQNIMKKLAAKMSSAWRKLDVAVLSKLIFEEILGIDEQKVAQGNHIEYVKDSGNSVKELVKLVDGGQKQAVFFMNPPKIKQIQDVADAGEKMPQKSTYFYPKVYSGLVIDKI
ncbi:MAG: DUF1015 domain-containing protein [Phycisphaerae bacterium]